MTKHITRLKENGRRKERKKTKTGKKTERKKIQGDHESGFLTMFFRTEFVEQNRCQYKKKMKSTTK